MKALMPTEDIVETVMMEDTEWMEIVTEDIPKEPKEDILTGAIQIVVIAEMITEKIKILLIKEREGEILPFFVGNLWAIILLKWLIFISLANNF